jgi:toxin ParE1/3/4
VKSARFHPEAAAELEEAVYFYDSRLDGLGQDFLAEVERDKALVQERPKIGAPYRETPMRYFVMRRFPYVIYYREFEDEIWIAAVAHGSRRPGYWRKRTT